MDKIYKNNHAASFKELIVYQKSRELASKIYDVSKSFPKEELYSLTDQIRRSSRSMGAQIAEAWGKRRYEKHFISKLTDADVENYETQHWLDVALECQYIKKSIFTCLDGLSCEVGAMLTSMINKAPSFCQITNSSLREDHAEYFTEI
jgi:four helix bundle protein